MYAPHQKNILALIQNNGDWTLGDRIASLRIRKYTLKVWESKYYYEPSSSTANTF